MALRRPARFLSKMAAVARFDYAKLTFPDVHPVHRRNVDDTISAAVGRLREEHPQLDLHLPKATVLDPSPAKPNGKYIIELHGFVAEALQYLPAGWAEYLTYVHVKSFVVMPDGWKYRDVEEVLKRNGGYRNLAIREYKRGNRSGTKKPGFAYTLGSGKSGCHLNCYQRPSQPIGLEGKFRDEQVKAISLENLELWYDSGQNDRAAWMRMRRTWGEMSALQWFYELNGKNVDIAQLFSPVSYEEWKSGAGGFGQGEGYSDLSALPEQLELDGSDDNA